MRRFLLGLLIVLALVLLWPLSVSSSFRGWQAEAEQAAIYQAKRLLGNPLERLLIKRLEVVEITDHGPADPAGCFYGASGVPRLFRAKVVAKTFFGIQWVEVTADCRGAARL